MDAGPGVAEEQPVEVVLMVAGALGQQPVGQRQSVIGFDKSNGIRHRLGCCGGSGNALPVQLQQHGL